MKFGLRIGFLFLSCLGSGWALAATVEPKLCSFDFDVSGSPTGFPASVSELASGAKLWKYADGLELIFEDRFLITITRGGKELARASSCPHPATMDDVAPRKKAKSPKVKDSGSTAKKLGVYIGMSQAEVLKSNWGAPSDKHRTVTASGVREQWIYGSGNYLYFENGMLSAIQN